MSDIHNGADGSPNMKLSSTKSFNTTNDENASNLSNNNYNQTDSGYLNENKKLSGSIKSHKIPNNEPFSVHLQYKNDSAAKIKKVHSTVIRKLLKHSSSISSHITPNNEIYNKKNNAADIGLPKKDIRSQSQIKKFKQPNNKEDISIKMCKDYTALPTDENGETIENSPEAISFRANYSLNTTPSVDFDFDSIQPVHYNGQNTSIHDILKIANHCGKKYLGKMTLYHSTSTEDANEIMKSKKFTPKKTGAAISFADNKRTAIYRAAIIDTDLANSLMIANVDMGTALIIEGPKTKFSSDQVKQFQCDSILYRKDQNNDWEYFVYEPSRIHLIDGYIFR